MHSDLKPANFLFVGASLKLIDFGIASDIPSNKTSVVKDMQVGTLNYVSPEAISGSYTENGITHYKVNSIFVSQKLLLDSTEIRCLVPGLHSLCHGLWAHSIPAHQEPGGQDQCHFLGEPCHWVSKDWQSAWSASAWRAQGWKEMVYTIQFVQLNSEMPCSRRKGPAKHWTTPETPVFAWCFPVYSFPSSTTTTDSQNRSQRQWGECQTECAKQQGSPSHQVKLLREEANACALCDSFIPSIIVVQVMSLTNY